MSKLVSANNNANVAVLFCQIVVTVIVFWRIVCTRRGGEGAHLQRQKRQIGARGNHQPGGGLRLTFTRRLPVTLLRGRRGGAALVSASNGLPLSPPQLKWGGGR
jgi:hypothetical protein